MHWAAILVHTRDPSRGLRHYSREGYMIPDLKKEDSNLINESYQSQ